MVVPDNSTWKHVMRKNILTSFWDPRIWSLTERKQKQAISEATSIYPLSLLRNSSSMSEASIHPATKSPLFRQTDHENQCSGRTHLGYEEDPAKNGVKGVQHRTRNTLGGSGKKMVCRREFVHEEMLVWGQSYSRWASTQVLQAVR